MANEEIVELIQQAFELKSKKMYKPAIEMLYKALSIENDNTEILFQLSELYFLMHNYTRAIGYIEQVLAQNPNHLETLKLAYSLYKNQEDFENALLYAQKVFDIENSSNNLNNILNNLGKLGKIDELKTFINYPNCSTENLIEIGQALYFNGESAEAKKILEKFPQEITLGKIYFDENNLEKAREIFSQHSNTTDNDEILNYQGLFALEDMNFIEAIKCFSKASSINKNNSIYLYNLANAYFFNGWMDEAQKAYSKAIYIAPDNMEYRYALAYLYFEIKAFDKCKKEVDVILSANPEHSQARVLQALLFNTQKDYNKAKQILEDNLKKYPDDNFTLVSLAKTYSYLDMYEKAEKLLLKLLEKNSENLNYISDLSEIYIKEKSFNKAMELAHKTISLNPNYIYGYVLGAKVAYLTDDYEKTKEFSQNALLLD